MTENKTIEVTDENFESEVLGADVPVLVDYWAPWCGPCRMAAPVLEKIADEYDGRLKVCKMNVDENREVASGYRIMSIPTLQLFKNGELVDQVIGVTPNYESDLKRKVEPHLD
jgi:thioredoxin 1